MKKGTLLTIIILLSIIIGTAVLTFTATEQRERESSQAFQALSVPEESAAYTDLTGNPIDLTDYAGKVLVVNSWASWCPFCVNELPDFSKLATEFSDQEVVVLAINRTESKEQVERFMRAVSATDGVTFVLDPTDHFYSSIEGFSMPETVFYDTKGNIVFHKRGFMAIDEMRQRVNDAINASNDQ